MTNPKKRSKNPMNQPTQGSSEMKTKMKAVVAVAMMVGLAGCGGGSHYSYTPAKTRAETWVNPFVAELNSESVKLECQRRAKYAHRYTDEKCMWSKGAEIAKAACESENVEGLNVGVMCIYPSSSGCLRYKETQLYRCVRNTEDGASNQ